MRAGHHANARGIVRPHRRRADPGDLAGKAEQWKAQASVLTRCNDDLAQYVKHLEHDYDMQEKADQVARFGAPAAEQLVREAEAFLRSRGK